MVLPPLLAGIAVPTTPVPVRGGTVEFAPDPAVGTLALPLGDATPDTSSRSILRQVGPQLMSLLGVTADRLRGMFATIGTGDAPATAIPMQPPPPTGPILTLDPRLGTIVDVPRPDDAGTTTSDPDDGAASIDAAAIPSSWVAVPGRYRLRLRSGLGPLADRISALLDGSGLTRMQLLLLTIAVPLAVAFGIDIADRILTGG